MADEADQRLCAPVWHHGESDAPGETPGLSLVEAACTLVLPDFDCACHEHHIVVAVALALLATVNPGFVGLGDLIRLAADPVLVGMHHAGVQLVKYLECGFVARQLELALELGGLHVWRLAGNEVRSTELHRKRRMGTLHDGARREAGVAPAMTASKYRTARRNVPWFIGHREVRTDESFSPSSTLKVGCARHFVWKQALKLRKRVRESQFVSIKHVDNHERSRLAQMLNMLPLIGGCDNRIGTE